MRRSTRRPIAFLPLAHSDREEVAVRERSPYFDCQFDTPGAPHPAYGVSKTAVFGLTRALAIEFAQQKVRVNCVAPGMVKTAFSEPLWKNPEIAKFATGGTLLKRLGEPEDWHRNRPGCLPEER